MGVYFPLKPSPFKDDHEGLLVNMVEGFWAFCFTRLRSCLCVEERRPFVRAVVVFLRQRKVLSRNLIDVGMTLSAQEKSESAYPR